MKKIMYSFFILSFILITTACVTVKPVGCENSVIYKYAPWSFVILTGAIDGVYMMYKDNPVVYGEIKKAAAQTILILQGTVVRYDDLQKVPNITSLLTSQLASIFRPGDVLDTCDKNILIQYMKML